MNFMAIQNNTPLELVRFANSIGMKPCFKKNTDEIQYSLYFNAIILSTEHDLTTIQFRELVSVESNLSKQKAVSDTHILEAENIVIKENQSGNIYRKLIWNDLKRAAKFEIKELKLVPSIIPMTLWN